VVETLIVSFGVVSGALLLAGDKDDGTMDFLERLAGGRGSLWARKCLAGALFALTQGLVLAGLAVGLGFGPWEFLLALPLLGLDVHRAPLTLWPLWTLVLGLTCGLAVFLPDQFEGRIFLGAQRFPPGRIWVGKILFWGTVLLGLIVLVWCVDVVGGKLVFP